MILSNISPARAQGPVTLNLVTFTPEATFRFSPGVGDKFKARWGEGPGQSAHFLYAVPGIPAHCIHDDGVGPWDFGEGCQGLRWYYAAEMVPEWRVALYIRTRPNWPIDTVWILLYDEHGVPIGNGGGQGWEDYWRATAGSGTPETFLLKLYGFMGEDAEHTGSLTDGAPVWK
ncbi:MAG: hypothetical protein FJ276_21940 [Planctomycetes bacterium]|nr:hypothetical protein [Planctomycetota bacterium]